jgi:glycosyltransferase involved in cell wall biosynthesis
VIFTIASANYLAHAATLMQSVRMYHAQVRRVIVLADAPRPFAAIDLAAELLPCDRLGIARIGNMKLWYTCIEFNTAIKPYAFQHFFADGAREIVYLDPDIELFAPLEEAFAALAGHSMVLTPHITEPLADDGHPDDLSILKTGAYNLGFLGLRRDDDAAHLLTWWARRTFLQCRVDVPAGFFTDQRWMDLAPSFVARSYILRHPGYNVAYWNVAHRSVQNPGPGRWTVNGSRLIFYHYSGLLPDDPTVFSRYQTRFAMADLGAVATLCDAYRARLATNAWPQISQIPYAYGSFADERRIEDAMRRWLLRAADEARIDPRHDIKVDPDYFDAPDETAGARGVVLTRMMYQLWLDRPDLRALFDIHSDAGFEAFYTWFTGVDAEVDTRSAAAARALCGSVADGAAPPWPRVATDCWPGPARDAGQWLGGDVRASIAASGVDAPEVILPRQVALLWELRADLRHAYRLSGPARLRDYIGWGMTHGCAEAGVDPTLFSEAFLASQVASAPPADNAPAETTDVPITVAMHATARVALRREYLNHWEKFPQERAGRLAHGLWFAFLAPQQFGWPTALAAPVRAWFDQPGDGGFADFTFSRAELALWELRPDLQQLFSLRDRRSCWGYLHWLCVDGLHELRLSLDEFDLRLRAFLARPSVRMPGFSLADEMIYAARADVQAAYNAQDPAGRVGLQRWLDQHFAASYSERPLAAVRRAPATQATAAPVERVNLVLVGQFQVASGRGEDARGSAAALDAVGFGDYVRLDRDSGEMSRPNGEVLRPGTRLEAATAIVHMNAETALQDWLFLRQRQVLAQCHIGFWAWELEYLPQTWRHAFAFYDEIWASTEFARAAFAREMLRPVRLVPMVVQVPERVPERRSRPGPQRETVFFFMFDFRSFMSRKNPEGVVAAFQRAFPAGDEPVRLVIKTHGAAQAAADWRRLKALAGDARIELRDVSLSRPALLAMMAEADVFVSLHRSEGFGRGPAEAMLLERPVIATRYSGTADFLDDACAYVVGCTMRPVRRDEYPGAEGQCWAEPDLDAASAFMRRCHEHPKEAAALGRRGAARVQQLYNPTRVGHAMLAAVTGQVAPEATPGGQRKKKSTEPPMHADARRSF